MQTAIVWLRRRHLAHICEGVSGIAVRDGPALIGVLFRAGRGSVKRQKRWFSLLWKGQKETERNNEKTEGWNKARKNDEQFAFVLARKTRVVARMHMVMKERGPDNMQRAERSDSIALRLRCSTL